MVFWPLLLAIWPVARGQSPCSRGQPAQLATVAVWVKHNGSQSVFRISDEDLTDEGFERSIADRDLYPVQLPRQPGSCPVGLCALRLSTSRRYKDGVLLQQEDIYGTPEGYEPLNDDFYCGRSFGDCGADVPIYRLTKGKGPDAIPAYSIDSSASMPGFLRDPRPICYGWSDGTGLRRPVSGDGCLRPQAVANGQTANLAVGTTATLHCSSGFLASGVASSLCTRGGWNPPHFGACVRPSSLPGSVSLVSSGSARKGAQCTAAATIKNGQILYSQLEIGGRLPSGTTASVLCFLGFVSTLSSSPKCENGDWIGQWPACIQADKVQCQPIAAPSGAKISYEPQENPLGIGATATLQCLSGSAIAGAVRSTCGKAGWQPKSLGMCVSNIRVKRQGLPCLPLAVFGGNVTYIQANPTTPYAAGTSALIACNIGYILQGSGSSVCQNGQWSPTAGTCSLSSTGIGGIGSINSGSSGAACLDFPIPFSGIITYSLPSAGLGTHPSVTVATLTCNLGSSVSGSLSSTCSNGIWSPTSLGTCTTSSINGLGNSVLECSNPIVSNGVITYSTSSSLEPVKPVGSTATLSCNLGYTLSGTSSSTCQGGSWVPLLGTCVQGIGGTSCPGGLMPPFGAIVTYSNGASFGPYPSGTVATMNCEGSQVVGTASSTCSSGQWIPSTLGTCSTVGGGTGTTCPTPTIPPGGTITYSQLSNFGSYNQGTTATLMCTTGAVTGSTTSTCQSGIWSPSLGTCGGIGGIGGITGSTCYSIIPPMGTTINYSMGGPFGPFNQGTTATVTCMNPTQQIIGTSTATCQNGQWTPSLSSTQCSSQGSVSGTQCYSGPITPFGATITYSSGSIFGPFQPNTVATMTCTSGYVQGSATSTCVGGTWSPSLGTCSSSGGIGGSSCSSPVSVPLGGTVTYSGGQIFAPFTANTVATLTCSGGYVQGQSTSTCTNGQWTMLGTCSTGGTGISCSSGPITPLGGTVTYSNGAIFGPYPSGTTVTLSCGTFPPTGSSTATCSNGQWSQLGTCSGSSGGSTGTSCSQAISTPVGGTLTYSNGAIFAPFPSGTTATLRCTTGTPVGQTTSVCTNGQWYPTSLATCSTNNQLTSGQQCLFAPTAPLGGTLIYSTGSTFGPWSQGTTVSLSCPVGQYAQGSTTATCFNGSWGTLATSCSSTPFIAGGCAPFSSLSSSMQGGIAVYAPNVLSDIPFGSTATLVCFPGYFPSGQTASTCTQSGWQPSSLGVCLQGGGSTGTGSGTTCQAQLPPLNGNIAYSQGGTFGPFYTGTIVSLTCTIGYTVSGSSSAQCSNGQWIPNQLGTCISGAGGQTGSTGTQCYTALTTALGTVTYSNGQSFGPWSSGTTASLTCSGAGYVSSGAAASTCINGQWVPAQLGTCSSSNSILDSTTSCQAIPYISGGSITYSSFGIPPYIEGTTATLVCNFGTTLAGQSTVTCKTGGWTPFPGLGSCQTAFHSPARFISEAINSTDSCPPPKAPPNGEITYSNPEEAGLYVPGTTAALRCKDGFGKRGATFATCRSGTFRPLLGSCDGENSTPTGVCLPLQSPINGRISYIQASVTTALEAGSTALLDCDEGYAISGRATLSCSVEGSWQPEDGFGQCELTNR